VMPQAFIAAMAGEDAQEFRQRCVNIFQQADALDVMITSLQETAQALAKADQ
ncbi:TPA: type I-F CRISPR-associated endonuclease Cas1f, partial [Escherichia coli]